MKTNPGMRQVEGRAAFTLVELLAVLSILMVLLALLLPAVRGGREATNRGACASNLRQLTTACFVYAQDFSGQFPPGNATIMPSEGVDSTYNTGAGKPLGLAILATSEYISGRDSDNGTRIFYCPTWSHPFFRYGVKQFINGGEYGGWQPPGKALPTAHVGISYQYRSTFVIGSNYNQPPNLARSYVKASGEVKPMDSNTAFIADNWYTWGFNGWTSGVMYGHATGYNAAYLDGHVVWRADPGSAYMTSPAVAGGGNHSSWFSANDRQERIWQSFFDQ